MGETEVVFSGFGSVTSICSVNQRPRRPPTPPPPCGGVGGGDDGGFEWGGVRGGGGIRSNVEMGLDEVHPSKRSKPPEASSVP